MEGQLAIGQSALHIKSDYNLSYEGSSFACVLLVALDGVKTSPRASNMEAKGGL